MLGFHPIYLYSQRPFLSISLVTSVFYITCCTPSTGTLAWRFLTGFRTGLIPKYFSKVMKSRLNSDPLSNTTFCGRRYLHIHVLLNSWLTLADYLYMYSSLPIVTSLRSNVGISKISNQPVAGSIIGMQVRLAFLQIIAPPGFYFLVYLLYRPIRSTCTDSHFFNSAIFLGGRCP